MSGIVQEIQIRFDRLEHSLCSTKIRTIFSSFSGLAEISLISFVKNIK